MTNHTFKEHFLPDSFDNIYKTARMRVNFIAQTLGDTIAFAEDMPVRILDIKQIESLPEIITQLAADKYIAQQYSEKNNGSLAEKASNLLEKDCFNTFSKDFIKLTKTYFKTVSTDIDNILESKKFEDIVEVVRVDQLNKLEIDLTEKINHIETKQLSDLLNSSRFCILRFLIPYLEQRIWRMHPGHDTPFVLLMRRSLFWRVYELLWLYEDFNTTQDETHKQAKKNDKRFNIQSAFAIKNIRLDGFFIDNNANLACLIGPTFEPISTNNSYVFFCERGLYLKHSFAAFLQLMPDDNVDHPGIEELNGALISRSFLPSEERERHIETIQSAWHLLTAASIKSCDIGRMSQRDIATLANYACFVSRYKNRFNKIFPSHHFALATNPHTVHSSKDIPSIWYLLEARNTNCQLTICGGEPINNQLVNVYPSSNGNGIKKFGERLWCSKSIQQPCYDEKILQRYFRYTERTKLRHRKYINVRTGALSEWFQRHFSIVNIKNNETSLLGEIGNHTCRLLCELTRGDVGVTIYHLANDKNNQYKLNIVGDYAYSAQILTTREQRQRAIDDNQHSEQPALCYKSIEEGNFLYEPNIDQDLPTLAPYPDEQKPHSVLIMPLYMESRVIGLIQVKGTQKSQFRWSQRHILHQVASVLAPYFYRQNLLESLSNISRWVFGTGSFAVDNNFFDKSDWTFNELARGLANIFLCRTALVWLVDTSELDRYLLRGTSDSSLYEKVQRDKFGHTAITFIPGKENLLQPLCTDLLQVDGGKAYTGDPFKFKVKNYHVRSRFIDDLGIADYFFKNSEFKEIMVFMLTLHRQGRSKEGQNQHQVIGFVTLFHDHANGFSQNWGNTIRLVNEQTSMYLEQLDYLRGEGREFLKITQHEFKQEANTFTQKIDSFLRRARFQQNTLRELQLIYDKFKHDQSSDLERAFKSIEQGGEHDRFFSALAEIAGQGGTNNSQQNLSNEDKLDIQFKQGIETAKLQKKALDEAQEAYNKLHKKIEAANNQDLNLFLGFDPNENSVNCNLREMINDVYMSRNKELNVSLILFDNHIPDTTLWKVRKEPLRRIIQNLIDNVVKYAAEKSTFEVGLLNKSSSSYGFYIKNDAIFDSTLKNPFLPGVRGSKTKDKNGEGFGLYIVKLCAKLLGYECRVKHTMQHGSVNTDTPTPFIIEIYKNN